VSAEATTTAVSDDLGGATAEYAEIAQRSRRALRFSDCANARCRIAADLIMTTRSRRWFLRLGAAWSAALVACRSKAAPPAAEPHALGAAVSPYGSRSRFENAARHVNTNTKVPLEEASRRTPLHDTYGIVTPSSLHFERHHAGVPETDPATHTLTVHGLVDRPLVFTVMKRVTLIALMFASLCTMGIDAQQPAPARGAVFVAYYWRAKPGMLDAYNDYIKTVAEPIDEDARRAGVFEEVRTVMPASGVATDWTHLRVFRLKDASAAENLSAGLDAATARVVPDEARRKANSERASTLRDLVRREVWTELR